MGRQITFLSELPQAIDEVSPTCVPLRLPPFLPCGVGHSKTVREARTRFLPSVWRASRDQTLARGLRRNSSIGGNYYARGQDFFEVFVTP